MANIGGIGSLEESGGGGKKGGMGSLVSGGSQSLTLSEEACPYWLTADSQEGSFAAAIFKVLVRQPRRAGLEQVLGLVLQMAETWDGFS